LGRTILQITTRDGKKLEGEIEHPLGSPERPLSFGACSQKFRKSSKFAVHPPDDAALERFISRLSHLEELDDVAVIIPELRSSRER